MSWYGGKESMVHEQVYGNSKDRLHHDCQSKMMVLMLMTVTTMIIMITNYLHVMLRQDDGAMVAASRSMIPSSSSFHQECLISPLENS